jgi:hypothetical protein
VPAHSRANHVARRGRCGLGTRQFDELLDAEHADPNPVGGLGYCTSVPTKPVARVRLSRVTESANRVTGYLGTPLWRAAWTEATRNGKTVTMGQSHHTEDAARKHVEGLLSQVEPSVGNVYAEDTAGHGYFHHRTSSAACYRSLPKWSKAKR